MADLKTGTTIGGTLVWTQGNFPLYPTGDTLLYKNFMIYSENNKPQADDNDFVSKAKGGIYKSPVTMPALGIANNGGATGAGLCLYNGVQAGEPSYGIHFSLTATAGIGGRHPYDKTNPLWATYFRHTAAYPWQFKHNTTVVAYISPTGLIVGSNLVSTNSPALPEHLTRKDYVDGLINTTTANANSRVLRAGDKMTGVLTAPNFISLNLATGPDHVPKLSQVVQKSTTLDYGTF